MAMRISLAQAKAWGIEVPAAPRRAASPDGMNRTEKRFSEILEAMRRRDLILAWDFEPEKFRMADRTWFRPDFRVVTMANRVAFAEVKARKSKRRGSGVLARDDAAVKLKTVAEHHPFPFFLASFDGETWEIDRVPSRKWGRIPVDIEWLI